MTAAGYLAGRLAVQILRVPAGVLLSMLALPLAVGLVRDARQRSKDSREMRLAALDARTAQLQLLFGALLAAGFAIVRA